MRPRLAPPPPGRAEPCFEPPKRSLLTSHLIRAQGSAGADNSSSSSETEDKEKEAAVPRASVGGRARLRGVGGVPRLLLRLDELELSLLDVRVKHHVPEGGEGGEGGEAGSEAAWVAAGGASADALLRQLAGGGGGERRHVLAAAMSGDEGSGDEGSGDEGSGDDSGDDGSGAGGESDASGGWDSDGDAESAQHALGGGNSLVAALGGEPLAGAAGEEESEDDGYSVSSETEDGLSDEDEGDDAGDRWTARAAAGALAGNLWQGAESEDGFGQTVVVRFGTKRGREEEAA